jgi:hypothetical protein
VLVKKGSDLYYIRRSQGRSKKTGLREYYYRKTLESGRMTALSDAHHTKASITSESPVQGDIYIKEGFILMKKDVGIDWQPNGEMSER